ncbi:MAG: methyltransferase domain-containing protein [Bacteroidota bacterium]
MDRVFDKAIKDYFDKKFNGPLLINNHYGQADEMPLGIYFRDENNLNGLESYALSLCKGKVLDVGAGVGSLGLILQDRSIEVYALDNSHACCDIMNSRGVNNILCQDILTEKLDRKYDTLLMMMNGFGICQTLDRLPELFKKFDDLLLPDGQILFDSSDVSYLYYGNLPTDHYFGEISYQYEYRGKKGEWFKWLYIDIETLSHEASKYGFQMQVLSEDSDGQYLGKLVKIN